MLNPRTQTPWSDVDLRDIDEEQWLPVPAFEGYYEVSSLGRVKSLSRMTVNGRPVHERILSQRNNRKPHGCVQFCVDGTSTNYTVLQLVVRAFFPLAAPGQLYYHRNKNGFDNRLANVAYGSPTESARAGFALGVNAPISEINAPMVLARHLAYEQKFCHFQHGVVVAKVCLRCQVQLPLSEFYANGNHSRRTCRECQLRERGAADPGKIRRAEALGRAGGRICSDCKMSKLLEEFNKSRNATLGKSNVCRACAKVRNARSYATLLRQRALAHARDEDA